MSRLDTTSPHRPQSLIYKNKDAEYYLSTDPSLLDYSVIYKELSSLYWFENASFATVQRAIANSLSFGLYYRTPRSNSEATNTVTNATNAINAKTDDNTYSASSLDTLVGFARVASDFTVFAYLMDVFVVPSHQGKGLATWMMKQIVGHPDLQNLKRFMLATRDAHEIYKRVGFTTPLEQPQRWMEMIDWDSHLKRKDELPDTTTTDPTPNPRGYNPHPNVITELATFTSSLNQGG